jgi:hypothetical protein
VWTAALRQPAPGEPDERAMTEAALEPG